MPVASRRISPRRIQWVYQRLRKAYGTPRPFTARSGLDQLIATLLSQNTTDANSLLAFRRLKKRFPKWEQVAAAAEAEIAQVIHVAGLSNTKSRRIKQILARVRADHGGRYVIASVSRMSPEQARAYLLSLPGIGAKTAACTLLFSYRIPVFPVDTHIHRLARRLGLIAGHVSAEAAHEVLGRAVPAELCHDLHLLMIQHGRLTCHARRPACARCALRARCPSREARPTPSRTAGAET